MKVREVIKLIEGDGWFWLPLEAVTDNKSMQRNLAASPSLESCPDDLAAGTLNSILKQAGLKEQR
jgi:hypothetical protein